MNPFDMQETLNRKSERHYSTSPLPPPSHPYPNLKECFLLCSENYDLWKLSCSTNISWGVRVLSPMRMSFGTTKTERTSSISRCHSIARFSFRLGGAFSYIKFRAPFVFCVCSLAGRILSFNYWQSPCQWEGNEIYDEWDIVVGIFSRGAFSPLHPPRILLFRKIFLFGTANVIWLCKQTRSNLRRKSAWWIMLTGSIGNRAPFSSGSVFDLLAPLSPRSFRMPEPWYTNKIIFVAYFGIILHVFRHKEAFTLRIEFIYRKSKKIRIHSRLNAISLVLS